MAKPLSVVRRAAAADALIKAQGAPAAAPPAAPPAGDPFPPAGDNPPNLTLVPSDPPQGFDPGGVDLGDDPGGDDLGGDPGGSTDFEHRFRVMEGKYKSETARMRADLVAANARLDQTTGLLATLSARKEEPPAPPAPPAPVVTVEPLRQSEIDEFGSDMLDATARFTMARVMPVIDGLRAEVARLTGLVNTTAATATSAASSVALSAREKMFATLDGAVSNWKEINVQPEFLNWLAQEDTMSGETRHTLLTRAFERNEAARVQRFFTAYLSESNSGVESAKGGGVKPNPPGAPSVVTPSALVAPGRGRAAPVQIAPQQMEWTPSLIAAFYNDVRTGVFRNDPDERDRLEADIFAAQRDGRVVAN